MRKAVAWTTLAGLALCAPLAMSPQMGQPSVQEIESRINAMQREHVAIQGAQAQILNELGSDLQLRREVIGDTQKLADLDAKLAAHAASDEQWRSHAPADLAVLQSKVDTILHIGMWLLGCIGSLVIGCTAWALKQFKMAAGIAARLRVSDESSRGNHAEVIGGLAAVGAEARAAYTEANEVNRKIESAGLTLASAVREEQHQ
jgi:hypothetical protein